MPFSAAKPRETSPSHHDTQQNSDNSHYSHLEEVIEHAAHLLPSQGPITVFIHHNTLHAFEDLPFDEAVQRRRASLRLPGVSDGGSLSSGIGARSNPLRRFVGGATRGFGTGSGGKNPRSVQPAESTPGHAPVSAAQRADRGIALVRRGNGCPAAFPRRRFLHPARADDRRDAPLGLARPAQQRKRGA